MKPEFSVSLMCMDFLKIKEQMEVLNQRVNSYHIDLMDGHYCRNITLSPDMIKTFSKVAKLPMDVHLMTVHPGDWIEVCAGAGAETISPHAETINTDAFRIMNLIEQLGCKKGIVLNPATPIGFIEPYLHRIDLLTLMTVDVGFAGQPFIEEVIGKISEAKKLREQRGYHYRIQIDGSCNRNTYQKLKVAGADIYIVGTSGLFGLDPDINIACDKMYQQFLEAVESGGMG